MPKNSKDAMRARRREVRDLYLNGVATIKIAEELGVHRNTIINDIKELSIARAKRISKKEATLEDVIPAPLLTIFSNQKDLYLKFIKLSEDVPTEERLKVLIQARIVLDAEKEVVYRSLSDTREQNGLAQIVESNQRLATELKNRGFLRAGVDQRVISEGSDVESGEGDSTRDGSDIGSSTPIGYGGKKVSGNGKFLDDVFGPFSHLVEVYDVANSLSSGVYFLVEDYSVVYVGKSESPAKRVSMHKKDGKKFNKVYVMPLPVNKLTSTETAFIDHFQPMYNDAGRSPSDSKRIENINLLGDMLISKLGGLDLGESAVEKDLTDVDQTGLLADSSETSTEEKPEAGVISVEVIP